MDARFKKTVISENVRQSLYGWKRRVKTRHGSSSSNLKGIFFRPSHNSTSAHLKGLLFKSSSPMMHNRKNNDSASSSKQGNMSVPDTPTSCQEASTPQANSSKNFPGNEMLELPLCSYSRYDYTSSDDDNNNNNDPRNDVKR